MNTAQEGSYGEVRESVWTRRAFLGRTLLAAPVLAAAPTVALADRVPVPRGAPTDLSFLRRLVHFRMRADWAAEPPMLSRLNRASPYYRVTVHHQGSAIYNQRSEWDASFAIQNVQQGHMHRRFGDIGYHLVIDTMGRAWEARSLQYAGAHVARHNSGNIGIMLLGNFEEQRPTQQQLECLNTVVQAVVHAFSLKPRQVYGHSDLGQTLCPGIHLYRYVDHLRNLRRSG